VKSLRWFRIWLQALSLRSDSMTRMHYDIAVILSWVVSNDRIRPNYWGLNSTEGYSLAVLGC